MISLSPCAGIIVIDQNTKETILVCTDYDNYSFPKGKRIKGETVLNNALRELNEETGLNSDDIQIINDIT